MGEQKIQCTNAECARWLKVPPEAVGRRIRCPACKTEMRVPGAIDELRKLDDRRHCRLRVLKGPAFGGEERVLEPDRAYEFGRSDTCNLQFPGPTVSRRHFSLHYVNKEWVLEDLNTTTGTLVNGLPVSKQALHDGDKIQIGAYELAFVAAAEKLHPSAGGTAVMTPLPKPIPIDSQTAHVDDELRQAEKAALAARGFADFTPDHLEAVGQESGRRYSLSLATRLILVAGCLAIVTVASIYGKAWLLGGSQATPSPIAAAGPSIPQDFIDLLNSKDVLKAIATLKDGEARGAYAAAQLTDMKRLLQDSIDEYRRDLYERAWSAVQKEDWTSTDQLLNSARHPDFGPLPSQWNPVLDARKQHDILLVVAEHARKKLWADARRELENADRLGSSPGVAKLRQELETAMGGGLLVKLHPAVEAAKVAVDGRAVDALDHEAWELPVGNATVCVTAPGYIDCIESVSLSIGQPTLVRATLIHQAPPPVWVLMALESVDAPAALGLALDHYAATDAVPPAGLRSFAEHAPAAGSKSARRPIRVSKIRLKSGEELIARIWDEMASGLNIQTLPKGDTRAIVPGDVAKREDFPPDAATEAVLAPIRAKHEEGLAPHRTLELLAKLWPDVDKDVAGRVCAPYLAACLKEIEDGCAVCAAGGQVRCRNCNGSGSVLVAKPCDNCDGAGRVRCPTCDGTEKIKCKKCGGTGKSKKPVSPPGGASHTVEETCRPCNGTGKVACSNSNCREGKLVCQKCKGGGQVDAKVPCAAPGCVNGALGCPVCGGKGTKSAMQPDLRRQAELEAAKRASASP